jgi:NADH-ubiquinone oxidoreductase chain 4
MIGLPIFTLFIFFLCAANIAAPPTINLLAEIFLMARIIGYDYLMLLLFPLGTFLGAVFTLFIYSYSQHGGIYFSSLSFGLSRLREIHVLFLHVFPVNTIILNSRLMLVIYLSSLSKNFSLWS